MTIDIIIGMLRESHNWVGSYFYFDKLPQGIDTVELLTIVTRDFYNQRIARDVPITCRKVRRLIDEIISILPENDVKDLRNRITALRL